MSNKNFKFIRKLKDEIGPRLRWLMFSNKNSDKNSPEYVSSVSGVKELKSSALEKALEAKVREQLKEEFPNIENMKSYELLVDAVVHNYKKNELKQEK